jgi:hypothetical protein
MKILSCCLISFFSLLLLISVFEGCKQRQENFQFFTDLFSQQKSCISDPAPYIYADTPCHLLAWTSSLSTQGVTLDSGVNLTLDCSLRLTIHDPERVRVQVFQLNPDQAKSIILATDSAVSFIGAKDSSLREIASNWISVIARGNNRTIRFPNKWEPKLKAELTMMMGSISAIASQVACKEYPDPYRSQFWKMKPNNSSPTISP